MRPLSYEVRTLIAKAVQAGELPRQVIADAFGCSIHTVNAIASRVNRGISLEPQLHLRGRKQKITGETAAAVLQYYAEHLHATLEEVISALHLDASVPTLSRYLHRHKRSYKKKGGWH